MWRVLGFAAAWTVMEVGQVLALQEGRRVTLRQADGHQVASIRFLHLNKKPIKNSTLRSAMQTRAGEPLQRRFLRNDLTVIENLYRGRGYMGAKVVGRTLELDDEGKLYITIKIDSGGKMAGGGGAPGIGGLPSGAVPAEGAVVGTRQAFPLRQGVAGRTGIANPAQQPGLRPCPGAQSSRAGFAKPHGQDYLPGRSRPQALFRRGAHHRGEGKCGKGIVDQSRPGAAPTHLRRGHLYDPEHLRQSSSNLARTDLFRSIVLSTPASALQDSLQSVEIRLEEKKYVHLGAQVSLQNTDSRVAANLQHGNWLGRGGRLGFDASLGQPLQGGKAFLTERNVFESGADLTVAAGLTEEWGQTLVQADPGGFPPVRAPDHQ